MRETDKKREHGGLEKVREEICVFTFGSSYYQVKPAEINLKKNNDILWTLILISYFSSVLRQQIKEKGENNKRDDESGHNINVFWTINCPRIYHDKR